MAITLFEEISAEAADGQHRTANDANSSNHALKMLGQVCADLQKMYMVMVMVMVMVVELGADEERIRNRPPLASADSLIRSFYTTQTAVGAVFVIVDLTNQAGNLDQYLSGLALGMALVKVRHATQTDIARFVDLCDRTASQSEVNRPGFYAGQLV